MKIRSARLAFFSPTGTSKAVVRGIARGLGEGAMEFLDVTNPQARRRPLRVSEDELLVLAVPVYMGRVPGLLSDWLETIRGRNTPAVCVVVYGNRDYEDALLELRDILLARGCLPIAGGAFVGEHSFSSPELPTAEGRPDRVDLAMAEDFGRRLSEKLDSLSSIQDAPPLDLPGAFPYGGLTELWSVDFLAVDESCTQCGTCAGVCPVGAIDPQDSRLIDTETCITCCACIKACPEEARSIKPGPVRDVAIRLSGMCGERREPEIFL